VKQAEEFTAEAQSIAEGRRGRLVWMSQYADVIVVSLIVLAAIGYIARLAYRRFTGKAKSCCDTKGGAEKKTTLTIGGKAVKR
jgi:hypothetical protein